MKRKKFKRTAQNSTKGIANTFINWIWQMYRWSHFVILLLVDRLSFFHSDLAGREKILFEEHNSLL